MSMFGSLMGDLDDDPIFGSHMRSIRHMNNMMNSLFSDPFGMMTQNALTEAPHHGRRHEDLQMMPFGFPPMPLFNMGRILADFDNMEANGNCHSFTSSSMMAMASGPDGRPQVYQQTMSTRTAPGGVKETKKTVCDSRTGTKKLAIGHHIGDRAHILEREQNIHNGEEEEHQEFINLDEDEAESFNNEWETRTRRTMGAIAGTNYRAHGGHSRNRPEPKQLALPDPSGGRHSSHSRWAPSPRRSIRPVPSSKTSGLNPSSRPKSSGTPVISSAKTSSSSTVTSKNRKREHTPDTKVNNKRPAVSDSDV